MSNLPRSLANGGAGHAQPFEAGLAMHPRTLDITEKWDDRVIAVREQTDRWTQIHVFQKGDVEIRVCWATAPTNVTFQAAQSLSGVDLAGGDLPLDQAAGRARLALTTSPVYVKGAVAAIEQAFSPIVADSVTDYTNVQGKLNWFYGYCDETTSYKLAQFKPMKYVETPWGYEWKGPYQYLNLTGYAGT